MSNATKIIKLKVNCGCGVVSNTIKEGLDHSVVTGHRSEIHGWIDPKAYVAESVPTEAK